MESSNTKQAGWVFVGSLMSFLFTVVSSMILSRYFNKEDYGTYKQVLYVYNTLLAVFTLGLPRAYSFFLPRVKLEESRHLIHKISFILFSLGTTMSFLLFFFADYIGIVLNNGQLPDALRLFAIVPTLMLPTMGLDGILATFRKAKTMAFYNIITRILMLLFVALPVLLFDMGYKEAIIGFVVASAISFVIAEVMIHSPLNGLNHTKTNISYKNIFSFALPLLVASIWGIIQESADSFFVSRYFGTQIFAEFANGNMALPFAGMIIAACATVLSPIYSKLDSQDVDPQKEIMPLWVGTFEKSAMLIYPLTLYTIFYADAIMVVLYGYAYKVSSLYFVIKALFNFIYVMTIGPLLINVGYVKYYSLVQMVTAIGVVLFDIISVYTVHSPYAISIVQLGFNVGGTIYFLFIIARYFRVSFIELFPIKMLLEIFVIAFIILTIIRIMTNYLCIPDIYTLCISSFLFTVVYITVCKKVGINYFQLIRAFIKRS